VIFEEKAPDKQGSRRHQTTIDSVFHARRDLAVGSGAFGLDAILGWLQNRRQSL
jgi:hypothetical protein